MQFALVAAIAGIFTKILAGPVFAVAIAAALAAATAAERTHAQSLRRVSFFAMPLFGRQLARAHAIAPLLLATSVPIGFAAGSALRHAEPGPELLVAIALAAFVATLVAMSSAFRDGPSAWLYGVGGALCGIAVTVPLLAELPHGAALTVIASVVAGVFALRAFGETLARYDPIAD
jgi:hypothetical protein